MKLAHESEQVKKEVAPAKGGIKSTAPLVDGHEDGPGIGRMTRRGFLAASLLAATGLVTLKTACSFHSAGIEAIDGGETDGGKDAEPDVDAADGGHDADVETDAGPDADASTDGGPDVDAGDGGDGGPVACSAASTGTFNAYMPASTPTAVGGYIFTYSGINGLGNATISITCGGSPVTVPANGFPFLSETILVPNGGADGKRIRVTPNSGNSLGTDISVTVENL